MTDARYSDGDERPLHLMAEDADDLAVISAIVQDAVMIGADMRWERRQRRFALLINRFRWERDAPDARGAERVRAVVVIGDVLHVAYSGNFPRDAKVILSLLSMSFQPGDDGTGRLTLTFAGDGALALTVEAVSVVLKDVTRPYAAVSGARPRHPGDT